MVFCGNEAALSCLQKVVDVVADVNGMMDGGSSAGCYRRQRLRTGQSKTKTRPSSRSSQLAHKRAPLRTRAFGVHRFTVIDQRSLFGLRTRRKGRTAGYDKAQQTDETEQASGGSELGPERQASLDMPAGCFVSRVEMWGFCVWSSL